MYKGLIVTIALAFSINCALASDWTGQPEITAPISGPPGFPSVQTQNPPYELSRFFPTCNGVATNLATCPIGTVASFSSVFGTTTAIPRGASSPISFVSIRANGFFPDSTSTYGVSYFDANIPLSQFATSSDVDRLKGDMQGFDQEVSALNETLAKQSIATNQGIALSLAIAGTGDISSDEHFAVSANWGTFNGENGVAAGFAMRVRDHLVVNAAVASALSGGQMAGRAGIRFGW